MERAPVKRTGESPSSRGFGSVGTAMSPHPRITAVLSACAAVLGAAVLMTGCGSSGTGASAQATAPVMQDSTGTVGSRTNLRLGFVTTVQHPYGLALAAFAHRVTAMSHGRVGVSLTAAYGGGDDLALLAAIRSGSIDGGSVSAPVWQDAGVQSFEALQMPLLITNYAIERNVITGPLATEMLKGTQALGLTGLAIHEGGLRKPAAADGCLVEPADFVGVQMRSVQSDLLAQSITALGAIPTAMPLSKVSHAVEDGSLNAIEANVGLVYTQKLYEVLTCMSGNVNLWPFPTVLAMNTRAWNRLTDDQEKWIRAAAKDLSSDSLAILTDPASTLVGDLCTAGLKFGVASPAQIAALRAAVQPVYDEYSRKQPTGSLIKQIEALKASISPPAPKPFPAGCTAP